MKPLHAGLAASLLVLGLAACDGSNASDESEEDVPFEILREGGTRLPGMLGENITQVRIIENQAGLDALYAGSADFGSIPTVDFTQYRVLLLVLDAHFDGWMGATLESIKHKSIEHQDFLEVNQQVTIKSSRCPGHGALYDSSYWLVKIEIPTSLITVKQEVVKIDC